MKLAFTHIKPTRQPTLLGHLLITTLIIGLFYGFTANIYAFLAPEGTPQKELMVIEGWIHDSALDDAVALFRTGNYSKIVCTGVPLETGSLLLPFKSYPEMTAARLKKIGIDPEIILTSVAKPAKKDRTYMSAVALRKTLIAHDMSECDIHLITTGPHGRRSRMLFQKALGAEYNIGVTCLPPASYEPEEWLTCSEGVRNVINELIAYTYAKLFFHP